MKNLQPVLKYLIWPGLALVTAGLVIGLLNGWIASSCGAAGNWTDAGGR